MGCALCSSLIGSSPHPSMTEEEDSQSELLIAEEKMSPEQEGQLMPRYFPFLVQPRDRSVCAHPVLKCCGRELPLCMSRPITLAREC